MNAKSSILLGVNVDHVATLRQARKIDYPDPIEAALIAEKNGADSITVHLREDRRHIQDHDVERLVAVTNSRVNLEMAPTKEMIDIACSLKPYDCCLVPEKREELTTEGGLDVMRDVDQLSLSIQRLKKSGIKISLFVDPDPKQIESSLMAGADAVEIHTGIYADSLNPKDQDHELERIKECAKHAKKIGLQVNAGHGLHYQNTASISAISEITELNIGHAIIARSVIVGMAEAVKEMKAIMESSRK
ncbi:MAG: pyridoxine 5'-phosphate synthase [Gammaproteobacteria bacterium]|jgi:pyridoxine 5-phosphate synthase|nr:pyridoxine 5'-phosphate synthase [Gammaproteobacteria bacterium]MBQ09168.1 pyridoxine 5'-phosphate synthase [Gammaproteobacteria bacterium]MDP6146771.1 pyridoxine 5'-phosphate synthase [Gammaproteobacteria bacterium]HJL79996.1 pyridoxine 5'-phosphate synthase [Gammaproteobacteria bacterium]HJM09020.1 pyridoxine 5'-phosphate synthase [Gammaproteobacteria bacterium]|tara:strand:- start:1259 stop:1999 length:741 start_codon:yes stop_codon:yes gene_type:complete